MEFSRENHFKNVTFEEFVGLGSSLAEFARAKMPGVSAMVYVSEDPRVLEKRSVSPFEELTKQKWAEAARVELVVKRDGQPFAVFLSCNRTRVPRRIEARTEGIADDLCDQICGLLDFPDVDECGPCEPESLDSCSNFAFAGMRP